MAKSLQKIIKQVVESERRKNVSIQIGKAESNGYSNNEVNVKGRSQNYSSMPSITGDANSKNQDLVIVNVNGSAQLPVIIAKGGYMAP